MSVAWPAHVALILVQLFFGSLPVLGKFVMRSLDPMALVTLRVTGGALLLVTLRAALRLPPVTGKRERGRVLVFALFGVVFNQVLFLEGLSRTTAINASVLTTAIPVVTTLLSIVLGQERATPLKGVGIALSLSGALVLIGVGGLDLGDRYLVGNLLVFLNTVSYSIYMVISKPMLERHAPLSVISGVFAYSLGCILPLGIPSLGRIDVAAVDPGIWGGVAAIVLFPTVGAYLLNLWALKRMQASVVAVYIYLQPLVTSVLGVVFLGEHVTGRTLVAAAFIFTGVFVVSRARRGEARSGYQLTRGTG